MKEKFVDTLCIGGLFVRPPRATLLSEFVHCDTCDVDYDVREVTNEVQHPHALHVMAFTCPKGHHSEARRLWKEKALHITEGDVISLRGLKVLWDALEEGKR